MARRKQKNTTPTTRGKVVMRALDSVTPNPWNPNRMTDEMKQSMLYGFRNDGWLVSQALLIWGVDDKGVEQNVIIDGEHRWTTANELGMAEGPMVVLDGLSESDARKLTIKMNQKRGDFRADLLADLLKSVESDHATMAIDLGFDTDHLERIFGTNDTSFLDGALDSKGADGKGGDGGKNATKGEQKAGFSPVHFMLPVADKRTLMEAINAITKKHNMKPSDAVAFLAKTYLENPR